MKNNIRIIASAAMLLLLSGAGARADEGMWLVNNLTPSLVQKMQAKGLALNGSEIYDADKESVKDAIVSIDFMGTGSFVSADGLVITNHHVAYGDVHALSTAEHNYLEDGFWAYSRADEIPVPGRSVQLLQKIVDVTDDIAAMEVQYKAEGKPLGWRKMSYIVEKEWSAKTGLEAYLGSMWSGSRYYISLYKVYTDVRLVAAPPVSIAAFGGDVDNWEWPQHKCDFAMYRVYAAPDGSPAKYSPQNVPLHVSKYLSISTSGYGYDSFAMVLGYPGRTDRYSSMAKVDFSTDVVLPITNEVRAEEMKIMMKWMNADPAVRLKYADRYFSLSNVQELQEGQVQCVKRFGVHKMKKAQDRKVRGKSGRAIRKNLARAYDNIREEQVNTIWYRETIVRGCRLSVVASRMKNQRNQLDMSKEYADFDLRVEKDLFRYCIEQYYTHVSRSCWGAFQAESYDKFVGASGACDFDALAGYLWCDGYMTKQDNIFKFFTDVSIADFNKRISEAEKGIHPNDWNREYTHALYQYRLSHGIDQYPDANSTMRLTYGTVNTFKRDGKVLPWQTWSGEILGKENPAEYDFTLKKDWSAMLRGLSSQIPVNFITDNDITGGNSGSPVLNAKGEVIGLAFDGNKESLAGDVAWTEGYIKCVCVDIRFVLFALKHYAHMDSVYSELSLVE